MKKLLAAGILLLGPTASAYADCQQAGSTVTCTGTDPNGFGTNTENNLVVTVQPGATVVTGINIRDGNTVINNGTITTGNNALGISGNVGNIFTNAGTMILGSDAGGLYLQGANNIVANTGSIAGTANKSVGIVLNADGNVVTNSGTISLSGVNTYGIFATNSNNNIIVNSGAIDVGAAGDHSIGVTLGTGNAFANSGTIKAGLSGGGVLMAGDNSTLINNGKITVGDLGVGAFLGGNGEAVTNNGTIIASSKGQAIAGGVGSTVTNNGTLDGQVFLFGSGNLLTNSGLIKITDAGTPLGNAVAVDGTFTQTSAGTLAVRVDSTGASDKLVATTANLGGTLRVAIQPGFYGAPITYSSIISATNPITSQFAQVTATSSPFFGVAATYNTTTVDLTLTRYGFGSVPGETLNQRRVGNALEANYSAGVTGNAKTLYGNLLLATSVGVLDRLSGEGTAGTQNTAFLAGSQFDSTLAQQADAWRSGDRVGYVEGAPVAYVAEDRQSAQSVFNGIHKAPPAFAPNWRSWGSAFGATQSLKGDFAIGSAGLSDRTVGGGFGFDVLANPDLLLGLGVGASSSRFDVSDRATTGRLDGGHLGAYAMQRWGSAYASALVSYTRFNNSTSRGIAGIGPSETANGSFASNRLGARFEIGNTWNAGFYSVTPFAAVQVAQLWQNGYSETSTASGLPGMLGLTYRPTAVTSVPTSFGAQIDTRMALGDGMVWSPYLRAAWVHDFSTIRSVSAAFNTVPAASFVVDGAPAARDVARIDLGTKLVLNANAALFASFNGAFSNAGQTYAGTGGIRVNW